MPFFTPEPGPEPLRAPSGVEPLNATVPSLGEAASAAFVLNNPLVSLARKLREENFPIDPDHNPRTIIAGTKYEQRYPDRFTFSRSEAETRATMRRIDEEEELRRVNDASGAFGTLMDVIAGVADPTVLLPAGVVVRGTRAGLSAARSAASVGTAAALGVAAAEGVLQATQETRTGQESAIAIGSGFMFGALIGAGASRLMTPAEHVRAVAALDAERADMNVHAGNATPGPETAPSGLAAAMEVLESNATRKMPRRFIDDIAIAPEQRAAVIDSEGKLYEFSPEYGREGEWRGLGAHARFSAEGGRDGFIQVTGWGKSLSVHSVSPPTNAQQTAVNRLVAAAKRDPEIELTLDLPESVTGGGPPGATGLAASVGAAVADTRDLSPVPYGLDSVPVIGRAVSAMFPSLRTLERGDPVTKRVVADMVEIPIEVRENLAGGTTTSMGGPPLEFRIRAVQDQLQADLARTMTELYADHRLGTPDAVAPRIRDTVTRAMGNAPAGKLSFDEFDAAVYDALSRGDQHPIPQVAEAAQWIRKNVLDPIGQRAATSIEGFALTQPRPGESYAPRIWNRPVIEADFNGAVEMWTDRLVAEQGVKAAAQERIGGMADRLKALGENVRKYEAKLERLDARQAALGGRLDERAMEVARAERRGDVLAERASSIAEDISEIEEFIAAMRADVRDPRLLERLDMMEREVAALRRADRPMTEAQARAIEQEELSGILTGETRMAAEMVVGRRNFPKASEVTEDMTDAQRRLVDAGKMAVVLDEAFTRAGVQPKTIRDVAKILRDDTDAPMTLDDLDRVVAEMEAVGQDIPASVRREGVENEFGAAVEDVRQVRATIQRARAARDSRRQRLRVADARGEEAGIAERASRGRLGVLEDRMSRAERRRALVVDALDFVEAERVRIRERIEAELGAWPGNSAAEARAALRRREQAEAERVAASAAFVRSPTAGRLASADDAVDRAVRRIIESDRDLPREELRLRAEQIVSRTIGTPEGRLPYDEHMGGPVVGVPQGGADLRGHAARREIDLPYDLAAPWLDRSATRAVQSYLHSVLPDAVLAERFSGDPNMIAVFRDIDSAYAARLAGAKPGAESQRLVQQRDSDMRTVAGLRDRLRGVLGYSPDNRNLARVSQGVLRANNIVSSHMMAIASLPDIAGAIFRHGLESTFSDGWRPFFAALTDGKAWDAWKRAGNEWRAAGIGIETAIAARSRALTDVAELYRPASRFERALDWASDKAFLLNLLTPMTDGLKRIAANVASHNLLRASRAVAEGRATAAQRKMLGAANIRPDVAERIWQQFQSGGGEDVRGVLLPNLADWTDDEARMAFLGAVGRDVNIAVMTPGAGDKPLTMSKAGWNVLGQYKSFMVSATLRIMIANLQRRDAAALSGFLASIALGMLAYKVNSLVAGRPTSDRPQDWIKEGLNRSGTLGALEEANSLVAKATRGALDVHRVYGADRPLSRFASRSAADMLLGPTIGKLNNIRQVTGAIATGEFTASDMHALRMVTLGSNLPYLPRLFDAVEAGANSALGIPPAAPRRN